MEKCANKNDLEGHISDAVPVLNQMLTELPVSGQKSGLKDENDLKPCYSKKKSKKRFV
jgi:hypothetical protein